MTHPPLTATGEESFFNGLLTDHFAELYGGGRIGRRGEQSEEQSEYEGQSEEGIAASK